MSKLKMWTDWDKNAEEAKKLQTLKGLKTMPSMVGITPETAKNLKWKSLKWMFLQDKNKMILKNFFKHPVKYAKAFLKSAFQKKPYKKDKDFFLYGIENMEEFKKLLIEDNTLFVMGFSYCHKPFECPSGRFTADCKNDETSLVCKQCFIGKCVSGTPKNTITRFIPTIHYIGEEIFDIVHQNPDKKVLFMITACEMTLEMFGDWGNMVGIQGVGVRLDGRICNTMKAFELSEQGIKPGLTIVLDETKTRMLDLITTRGY